MMLWSVWRRWNEKLWSNKDSTDSEVIHYANIFSRIGSMKKGAGGD